MGIGLGVILLLAGLILVLNVINYDIPHIDDHSLGVLLILVGAVALVLSLVINAMRSRRGRVEEHHYDHHA